MKMIRNAVLVVLMIGVVVGSSLWIGLHSTNDEPATSSESTAKTDDSSYKPWEEVRKDLEASLKANSKETFEPEVTESGEESTQVSPDTASLPVADTSSAGQVGSTSEPSNTVSESTEEPIDEPEPPIDEPIDEPEPPIDEPVSEPLQPLGKDEVLFRIKVTGTDGTPVPSASVLLGNIIGTTDENGVFERNVPQETFDLFIDADGCVSHYEELVLDNETKWEMVVTLEYADQIRKLLNSATLRPYRTDNEELNRKLDDLFDELFEPGMDTYDKVRTCYDWVIEHMKYKRPSHTHVNGYWECAYNAIQEGVGQCNCYSAVFTAMMRHLGLNCYYVEGSTTANRGGMTGHDWTVIKINEGTYIFDPQVEDAIAGRTSTKTVTYTRFCLMEPHSKYVYSKSRSEDYQMKKFDVFLETHGSFLGN